jgi:hypothetical protein
VVTPDGQDVRLYLGPVTGDTIGVRRSEEATMDHDTEGVVLLDVVGDGGTFDRSILERLGHPVVECSGPDVDALCPLLGGQGCPKFEQAHGIVFELDLDRAQHRAILRRYRELAREDLPIRAVITAEQQERYAELLADVDVWDHQPSVADLDGFAARVEAGDRRV